MFVAPLNYEGEFLDRCLQVTKKRGRNLVSVA
jgi:hypothetical protein